MTTTEAAAARADWEQRIYRRLTDTRDADPSLALPAPSDVRATGAVGHVRLDWAHVEGAAGYLIERVDRDGSTRLLQHGGSDVPAVPAAPFADTGLTTGAEYGYRIAAVPGAEYPAWNWSEQVTATVVAGEPAPLQLDVDGAPGGVDEVLLADEAVVHHDHRHRRQDDEGHDDGDQDLHVEEPRRSAVPGE